MNKKLIRNKIIATLVLAFIMSTQVFAQKTEYYRHLVFRETPFSNIIGNHQIDKATAHR